MRDSVIRFQRRCVTEGNYSHKLRFGWGADDDSRAKKGGPKAGGIDMPSPSHLLVRQAAANSSCRRSRRHVLRLTPGFPQLMTCLAHVPDHRRAPGPRVLPRRAGDAGRMTEGRLMPIEPAVSREPSPSEARRVMRAHGTSLVGRRPPEPSAPAGPGAQVTDRSSEVSYAGKLHFHSHGCAIKASGH